MNLPTIAAKCARYAVTAASLIAFCTCVVYANPQASVMFPDNTTAPLASAVSATNTDDFGTTTTLTYVGNQNDKVPALLVVPTSTPATAPSPCIILIHGTGGSKEQMLPIARLLSRVGYATLSIDLPGFGERTSESRATFQSPDDFAQYFTSGMIQAVTDLRRGVDYLATRRDIDPHRIGVLGISLGSFVAVDLAAADPRVKATALIASGGGLVNILNNEASHGFSYGGTGTDLVSQLKSSRSAQSTLESVDPLAYVAEIAPRPILMQNGAADPVVPPSAARDLYKKAGQPKHIDVYPNEGHIPSPLEMYVPLTQFFSHYLATPSEASLPVSSQPAIIQAP